MTYVMSNYVSPSASQLAIMDRFNVGRYYNIGGHAFSAAHFGSIFTGLTGADDWSTFATEGDFEDALDADLDNVAAEVNANANITHVVLDIETLPWYEMVGQQLDDGPTIDADATDIARFVTILDMARVKMPGRKFAFYNMPGRSYSDAVAASATYQTWWYARSDAISDILDASDFITSAAYVPYTGATQTELEKYGGRVGYNMLRLAGTKPVLPMLTWDYGDAGAISQTDWSYFLGAMWNATEADWEGNSGTRNMSGILAWDETVTGSDFANWMLWMHQASPPGLPKVTI